MSIHILGRLPVPRKKRQACQFYSHISVSVASRLVIYEGVSNENLKSTIKIRTTSRLSVSFNSDTHGLKSGRQEAVRYYSVRWSHCIPFVFNELRDKTYLRFSFDSPSYLDVQFNISSIYWFIEWRSGQHKTRSIEWKDNFRKNR